MASDDSSSHRSQEHSQLPNRPGVVPIPSTSLEAYAIRCEAVSIDPESRRLMRDPVVEADHRINGSLRHAIINQEEDWALIPLDNPRYSSNNVLSVDHDTEKIVQGISENMPLGTIFLGSGVSGPSHTVFYRTHSLFLLPSSRCLQVLWGAAATTSPGDSGAWAIDDSGWASAMLVAASDDDHEIFCLPLAPILASIEDTTSQRGNVTLANHDRGNMDSDGSMDVPSLISADAEENDDVVDSAVPRVGMAEVNEHQTSLASAHGSVHLHYGRNRHVSNRTSQRPKTNLQPIAAQQSAVVRSGDASIRSENQDHESIPIPDQKVSSRQELPQPGSDPHMGVMLINMADMTAHLPRSNAPLHIRDHSTTVGRASDIHYPQLGELEKASLGSNGRMSSSRSTNIRGSAVELEEPSRTRKGLDRLRSMLSRPKSSVSSTRSGHGSKPMYKEPRQFRRSLEASSTPVQQLDKGQVLTRSDTPEPEVHRGVGSPELVEKYVRQRLEAEGYSGPAVEAYSRTATEAAKMYADDPFNQTTLFAKDGQPIKYYYNGVQDVNYSIALPDRLAIEEVKSQDKEKAKNKGSVWGGKTPKPKSQKNDEVIDLDALLGDDLKDGLGDTVEFEDDAPIEIKHKKSRSRTKRQSRDGEFWKRRSSSSDSSRRDYTVSSVDGKEKPKKQIDTRNADGSGPRKEYTMHNAQGQPQLAALHNLPYREPDYFDATEILAARQPYDRTRESPYPYNPRPEHSRDLTYLHQYQEREMELLRRERDLAKNELDIARREAALAQQEAVAKLSFPARSATQNPTVESID